jgi:Xaa-Pro aminopeptidase
VSIFTPDEIKRRQESLGKEMARVGIDCALIHTADNVCYVTGVPLLSEWGRPMWAIVEPSGRSVLIGANIERENMEREGVVEQVRVYGDDEDVWTSALSIAAEIIETSARGARGASKLRVGVEFQHITAGILRSLQDLMPTADFVDVSELLARLRIIKSDDEIGLLTLAGTVAQAGARAFLDAVHPGVTESEIAGSAVLAMNRSLAVSSPACLSSSYAYCQAGEHTLTPHLHPTGRTLRIGDLVDDAGHRRPELPSRACLAQFSRGGVGDELAVDDIGQAAAQAAHGLHGVASTASLSSAFIVFSRVSIRSMSASSLRPSAGASSQAHHAAGE